MSTPLYLSSMGIICALGSNHQEILTNLLNGSRHGMVKDDQIIKDKEVRLGKVQSSLPTTGIDAADFSRNNQLLLAALAPVLNEVNRLKEKYGNTRIGVVLASSTSGTLEAEHAMTERLESGEFPAGYDYKIQEMGDPSRFLARHLDLYGPAYTVSTACSSSGKVFATGRNLISSGFCDAVLVGGADSLCRLTVNGFSALESVASGYCQPFSMGRDGINLGEGAALFTLTRDIAEIRLYGVGESSDAHHISAPHPEGLGAETAMKNALCDAGMDSSEIEYLNLHGTATPLNDSMESKAVDRVFGSSDVLCSSTKSFTGHTLGAAGAIEAGLAWLLLSELNRNKLLPPHVSDNPVDPELAPIRLTKSGQSLAGSSPRIMSNSFAFGGSNVSVILGR